MEEKKIESLGHRVVEPFKDKKEQPAFFPHLQSAIYLLLRHSE